MLTSFEAVVVRFLKDTAPASPKSVSQVYVELIKSFPDLEEAAITVMDDMAQRGLIQLWVDDHPRSQQWACISEKGRAWVAEAIALG